MVSANIIIIGANFMNKGAEAMLKTAKQELSWRIPLSRFYMVCHHNEEAMARQYGFIPISMLKETTIDKYNNIVKKIFGKIRKTLSLDPLPYLERLPLQKIKDLPQKPDIVLDISGFAYGDFRGAPQIKDTLKLVNYCKKNGIKFYFLPQAWGSFSKETIKEPLKRMLLSCNSFFSRDNISTGYLAEILKVNTADVLQLPDIAFSFTPLQNKAGIEPYITRFNQERKKGKLIFCISPNMRIFEKYTARGADNPYAANLLQLAKVVIEKMAGIVVLLPNEMKQDNETKDDRFICRLLYDELKETPGCVLIDGYYSADHIHTLISHMDLMASSRFHSLVFALSAGVPCMAISWSHKYKELLSLFNLQQYVIDYENMNAPAITSLVNDFFKERTTYPKLIRKKSSECRLLITKMFDHIADDPMKARSYNPNPALAIL